MLRRIIWILASIFTLMVAAPDRPPFSSAFAFAAGSGSGSAAPGKVNVARTQDNGDALSAFMSSPVYTRVADAVASTVEAGPLFPLRGGLVCQRMTQTVKIDGQNVHASALMCRNPNGVWKIAVPPGSQDATTTRGSTPPADRKSNVPRPSPTGSPVAKVQ